MPTIRPTALVPIFGGFTLGDRLWDVAGRIPSLDLQLATTRSLVDATTGSNLVTHTRASPATFVDSSGVLRSAVTNLFLNSEDFGAATWSGNVITNVAVSPTGATTADSLLETASSSAHIVYAISQIAFTTATSSVHVKPNGRTNVALRFFAGTDDWVATVFSLTGNGSVTQSSAGSSSGFSAVSGSIVDVGNGWYRISMTATQASRLVYISAPDLCTSSTPTLDSANGAESYLGDITKGVFIWGAQLEQSATVGEYVPTTSTINSAPRFDHNPATGESLGLLVEEQRTNLLLRSEEADSPLWNIPNSSITVDPNVTVSPDGFQTADKVKEATTTGGHTIESTGFAFQSGTIYTVSFYAKAAERSRFRVTWPIAFTNRLAFVDISPGGYGVISDGGTVTSVSPAGNDWFRVVSTSTCTTTTTGARVGITLIDTGTNVNYTGDGTSGIYLWGAQLEVGAFATSYIPTTGAAATRSADVPSITGSAFTSFYSQSAGTLFSNARTQQSAAGHVLTGVSTGSFAGSAYFVKGSTNLLGAAPDAAPSNLGITLQSVSSNVGLRAALAFTAGTGSASAVMNGGTVGTDASTGIPITMSQIGIGTAPWSIGTTLWNGHIARLTYWPTRLSNEVLQRITQ